MELSRDISVHSNSLGQNIKLRRKQLDMSQTELALKLGYKSRSSINKIESGENDIPQLKIKAFADALDCSPAELIGHMPIDDKAGYVMTIGANIKKKRIELGLTLEEVSKAIGTSKQTIQRYETGVISNIPSNKVQKLAHLFGVSPGHLMGWENAQTSRGENESFQISAPYLRFAKEAQEAGVTIEVLQLILRTINLIKKEGGKDEKA